MKKSLFALASIAMLVLGSCSNDEPMPEAGGGDGNVSFTVTLPQGMESRAFAQAEAAKTLTWAVYETGQTDAVQTGTATGGLQFDVTFNLVRGKVYDFVFWADKGEGSPYTFTADAQTISVDYTNAAVNDDTADAFFNVVKGYEVTGAAKQTVMLRRPFAQINVGTSDIKAAEAAGVEVATTKVTVEGVYSTLNLMTGIASDPQEKVEFAAAARPENETFPYSTATTSYDYLAMVYVLTGTELEADDVQVAQSELFDVTVDIACTDGHVVNLPVVNAPVQRNYRTNIFGALLTSPLDWAIIIEPGLNEPAYPVEYDNEGFRVATSLENALALVEAGEEEVAVEGKMLAGGASQAMSRSRAGVVEFLLNKAVKHQKIKIVGDAAADVKVTYGELSEGATEAESHMFTLIVTTAAKGVEVDLEGAEVAVEGKVDAEGNKATVDALTITNAEAANVSGTVAVEDLSTGDSFEGEVEYEGDVTLGVSTAADFVAALVSEGVTEINVKTDLDLTAYSHEQLTLVGAKVINLADDITIQLGDQSFIMANYDLTIVGNATITNVPETPSEVLPNGKVLLYMKEGTLTVENVTLINDPDYHYNRGQLNSACISYGAKGNVELKNVTATSGEFVIVGYNRSTTESIINMTDCYLESTSSSQDGTGSWAYAAKIHGKKSTVTNCTIVGIQGALSADYCSEMTINGGDYSTHYKDADKKDGNPYSALYVTGESKVTILDGKFFAPVKNIAVRAGDNDVNFPSGLIIVKGGKYSDKPWNTETKLIYEPEEGYIYEENTGADKDRYPWVVVKD